MIYGLVAAVGWGLAEFFGALSGQRMGSISTVVVGQGLSAAFMTVVLVATGRPLGALTAVIFLIALNGLAAAVAYLSHYRALELGPVAVVSPIGASYAVSGVLLAIVFLGERPTGLAVAGMVITVLGAMLVSTDLAAVRAGVHQRAPGVPWAVGSSVTFGVAGFLLGWIVQESDWIVGLWASRVAQMVFYLPLFATHRHELSRLKTAGLVALAAALAAGAADILGVTTYSIGVETGDDVSLVLAASAVFPLVAVVASHVWLKERLVSNQYGGVAAVVAGLVLLGLGS